MPYGSIGAPIRRRRRAGDSFFTNLASGLTEDYADAGAGLPADTSTPADTGGADDESAGLDMSAIGGGGTGGGGFMPDLGSLSLAGIGSDIQKFLGGPGTSLGPAIGSGLYGALKSKTARRLARKFLGGGRSSRRMNPGNFRALRRAMHRLTAFERAARHVIKFTHPSPHARVKFKFRRRRKRS